jgi:hypothetical protein
MLLVSLENRAAYNQTAVEAASPSSASQPGGRTFGADFQSGLVTLDHLDGADDWNGGAADAAPAPSGAYPHPLTRPWIESDALIVDPNKPFDEGSYLDVEAHAPAHLTCGGRWPGDDALDKTLSFLVKRSLVGVSDGVPAPARAPSLSFPYLAAPF